MKQLISGNVRDVDIKMYTRTYQNRWIISIPQEDQIKLLSNLDLIEDIRLNRTGIMSIDINPSDYVENPEEYQELLRLNGTNTILGQWEGLGYSLVHKYKTTWRFNYMDTNAVLIDLKTATPLIEMVSGELSNDLEEPVKFKSEIIQGLSPILSGAIERRPNDFPEFIRIIYERFIKNIY